MRCERRLRHLGIGRDEAEHGCHVGADHAGALRDAGDRDLAPADFHAARGGLGHRVGGHDGVRRIMPVVGIEIRNGCGNPAIGVRPAAASRITPVENGRTCSGAIESFCADCGAGSACCKPALLASAGVGDAGVDDQRTDVAAKFQMAAADVHRCGAKAVAGKHAGYAAPGVECQHGQVVAMRLTDGSRGDAETNAGNRIDGHCNLANGEGQRQCGGKRRLGELQPRQPVPAPLAIRRHVTTLKVAHATHAPPFSPLREKGRGRGGGHDFHVLGCLHVS
jgi:hypothetical protein